MALKPLSAIVILGLVPAACNRPATPANAEVELDPVSVTRWTATTELFAEYPPLVVGETSRLAIHLTWLDSFAPVERGRVEVHLQGGGPITEVFAADAPSRPGIFGVDVAPAHAGRRDLVVIVESEGRRDRHDVGPVDVFATTEAARAVPGEGGEEPAGVSFLKEQQWTLEFGTALVREEPVRESIRVPARVEARPGGAADVAAPVGGRLTRVVDLPLGARVSRGQELARLLPPPAVPGDLPQLQRARAEAQAAFSLATRDRERAERLTDAGAVPAKRLDEARSVEEQARARLAAAEDSLAQYNAARTGDSGDAEGLFVVRAPVTGVIAARDAAPGANVPPGAVLFRIVDATDVRVVGLMPEAEAARVTGVTAAELEVAGRDDRVPAGRLVSTGKVLDPQTRTLPITFALDNRELALPVGQAVFLHLLTGTTPSRPVVPAAAVVDDAGRPIVFVQLGGETFERRPVTLGPSSGGIVQVVEGIEVGERIVTRGAYLVRLASLSTTVPAHGHVH